MDIEELDLAYVIGRLRKYAESSDLSETGHKVYTTAANQLESQQVELFDWIVKSATANTEIESLRTQLQQSEARVKELEKEAEALKTCIEGLEKSTFFTCSDCGNKVMHKYADEHFCDY